MRVKVGPYIFSNSQLVFNNLGNVYSFNQKSDLVILFDIVKDKIFRNNGLDLIKTKTISLKTSLTKNNLKIQNIDKSILRINIEKPID